MFPSDLTYCDSINLKCVNGLGWHGQFLWNGLRIILPPKSSSNSIALVVRAFLILRGRTPKNRLRPWTPFPRFTKIRQRIDIFILSELELFEFLLKLYADIIKLTPGFYKFRRVGTVESRNRWWGTKSSSNRSISRLTLPDVIIKTSLVTLIS